MLHGRVTVGAVGYVDVQYSVWYLKS